MTRMSDVERVTGKRADFHVYYRRNGKLYFDAMWATDAEAAAAKFSAFAKELRWKVEVVRVKPITPDA